MNTFGIWYFEWPLKIVGIALFLFAIATVTVLPIVALIMFITGVVILTSHYGLHINKTTLTYKEYTWFLFWKIGKEVKFDQIEYLYIKANKVSRTYNSRIQSATITDVEYDGYIKFSETEKIHITHARKREQLIAKLSPLKKYLNVKILDYTREVPTEIS
jgi:hypothetical protein